MIQTIFRFPPYTISGMGETLTTCVGRSQVLCLLLNLSFITLLMLSQTRPCLLDVALRESQLILGHVTFIHVDKNYSHFNC